MTTGAARELGRWSHEVVAGTVAGHLCNVFRLRPASLAELFGDGRRWGTRPHLAQGDTVHTFDDLDQLSEEREAQLRALGVAPGERVALSGYASPEWVVDFWAAHRVGATVVPCSPWWSRSQTETVLARTAPAVVLENGVVVKFAGPANGPPQSARPAEEDPALVLFTAGTTATPKGVVLAQRSIIAGVQNLLSPRRLLPVDLDDDHRGPVSLVTLPLFHIGGITTIISNLLCGGLMVFPGGKFDPEEIVETIEQRRVTTWGAIPTMVSRVLDEAERRPGADLTSLRTLVMGGAPVPTELAERIRTVFPNIRLAPGNTYGMTETSGHVATAVGADAQAHPGSSGFPLPTIELRIDPHDDAPAGSGEILVRSPANLVGYWGDSTDPLDEEGWFHTGDLGRIDAGGRLWVDGRLKEVIIRGGENVSANRVEAALRRHPSVHDAAVVGLSHPDLGEEVAAVVVLSPETNPSVRDLTQFLAAELSYFEIPTRWWLRHDPLPVTETAKVRKRDLVAAWPAEPSP